METLRGIKYTHSKRFETAQIKLKDFEKLDITQDIYDMAIKFARFCKSRGLTLKGKCEAIDYIHFITAKYYGLEIVSLDGDLSALEDKYQDFIQM